MFVRWKKRPHRQSLSYSLTALLVQAVRIEGKPRQHVLANLGTLHSSQLDQEQPAWWARLLQTLDRLQLDDTTRARILESIAQKTPRPANDLIDEVRTQRAYWASQIDTSNRVPAVPPRFTETAQPTLPPGPLALSWKVDQPWPKRGLDARYHVSLVQKSENDRKTHTLVQLATIFRCDLRGESRALWPWKRFWFNVHTALCFADVNHATYQECLHLLGAYVRLPTEPEWQELIAMTLKSRQRTVDQQIKEAIARTERLLEQARKLDCVAEHAHTIGSHT